MDAVELDREQAPHSFWTGKPPFFWIALAVGCVILLLFAIQTVNAFRFGPNTREIGWRADSVNGSWIVTGVDQAPAIGKLQIGDRILSIDNYPLAATVGPHWILSKLPAGAAYSLETQRASSLATISLRLQVKRRPEILVFIFVELLVAAVFFGTGMMIALAKPEDAVARRAFVNAILVTLFLLYVAADPLHLADLRGWPLWLTLLLGSVFPFQLVSGYRFYAVFPAPVPSTSVWKILGFAVYALGALVWILYTGHNILEGLTAQGFSAFASARPAMVRLFDAVTPAAQLYVAFSILATLAIGIRNYRSLTEGDARRRLRWVFGAVIVAALPLIAIPIFWAVAAWMGRQEQLLPLLSLLAVLANALIAIVPLAMGYAIIKHRVLGIRVAIRLGLQYLFATNVLRVVVFLPVAALAYNILSSRNRTIGELLLQSSAKWNLLLMAALGAGLRYRHQLRATIDRRFFREAHSHEQILLMLIDSIKQVDSVAEMSALVSKEVQAALHPRRVVLFYRESARSDLSVTYSSGEMATRAVVPEHFRVLEVLARLKVARSWYGLRKFCDPGEIALLDELQAHLLVPILTSGAELVGLILLGEKRSEEPYTAADRNLLQAIATQCGVVYENVALRGQVKQGRQAQEHVVARLEGRNLNIIKECPVCGCCYDCTAALCSGDGAELILTLPVERVIDGKYQLERLLGKGGMGAVYQATDLRLKRPVAVKVMLGSLFGNATAVRRFSREAQASANLNHPNIVRVHDFGELTGDGAYLVMEYVQGVSWRRDLSAAGVFAPDYAAALFGQFLDGVEVAHQSGIVHRDLKPENLILAPRPGSTPVVKILDFGLAKVRALDFADPQSMMTRPGTVMGTLGYMSPEQYLGREVDERTDIYSIGVIALETLTGPLGLPSHSFHQRLEQLSSERFEFSGAQPPHERVGAALRRCLCAERTARYQDIEELRAALLPSLAECPPFPITQRLGAMLGFAGSTATMHRPVPE